MRAYLRVSGHLSIPLQSGEILLKALFLHHIKENCRLILFTVSLMLNVKQGNQEYHLFSPWFEPTWN